MGMSGAGQLCPMGLQGLCEDRAACARGPEHSPLPSNICTCCISCSHLAISPHLALQGQGHPLPIRLAALQRK